MLRRAIDRGVSRERLARAFNVNLRSINRRINLLEGTQHPRIMKAHEQYLTWPQLEGKLNALSMAMSVNDVPVIRALLKDLISGYPTG